MPLHYAPTHFSFSLRFFSSFTMSSLNLRIPSANFSVAHASSFNCQRNVASSNFFGCSAAFATLPASNFFSNFVVVSFYSSVSSVGEMVRKSQPHSS